VPAAVIPFLERLDRAGRALENILLVGLLGLMMVLGVGQIVLREVFNSGISWADELSRLAVLWLAMVATIAAARENRHIRIDALSHVLPAQVLRGTRLFVDLFAATVCAVIAWHTFRYLELEIEFGDTVLRDLPAWIAHSVVPGAFALTAYRFVVGAARSVFGPVADGDERAPL
jgi:TRAP-type C4-dicarboxylate transport system permease small subunit